MPIYEYLCSACGHQEEFLQKLSDKPLKKCPKCGKAKFEKMLSTAGFQLKGSGWYATDFKAGGKTAQPKVDAKPEAKPEAKADAKPEAKSEAKKDSKKNSKTEAAA